MVSGPLGLSIKSSHVSGNQRGTPLPLLKKGKIQHSKPTLVIVSSLQYLLKHVRPHTQQQAPLLSSLVGWSHLVLSAGAVQSVSVSPSKFAKSILGGL